MRCLKAFADVGRSAVLSALPSSFMRLLVRGAKFSVARLAERLTEIEGWLQRAQEETDSETKASSVLPPGWLLR
jgi:hypothetical protein